MGIMDRNGRKRIEFFKEKEGVEGWGKELS